MSIPNAVLTWSRGLASLSPGVVPCRGLREAEWAETHRRCQEFVECWGMQTHAAGWGTTHLFGVSPDPGAIPGDFCGHLLPLTRDMTEFTDKWIKLGVWSACRNEPIRPLDPPTPH